MFPGTDGWRSSTRRGRLSRLRRRRRPRAHLQRRDSTISANCARRLSLLGYIIKRDSGYRSAATGLTSTGEDLVPSLAGMFAFASGTRATNASSGRAGLAESRYTYEDGCGAVLCSEVRALLRHPRRQGSSEPSCRLDYLAIATCRGPKNLVQRHPKLIARTVAVWRTREARGAALLVAPRTAACVHSSSRNPMQSKDFLFHLTRPSNCRW